MAAWIDACRYSPTAGGTADWTFSAAILGYQSPALAGVTNGQTYKYRAESTDLTQWELGEGTYNTATGVLTRTTVFYNSLGSGTAAGQSGAGTKINFSTTPQVAIVAMKEDMLSTQDANAFTAAQISQALQNLGNASSLFPAVVAMGAAARVTSGDVNNLVNDGFYTVEGACTNQPVAGIQFFFMVQKYAAGVGFVSQVALDVNTVGGGAMYMRSSLSSVFGAWHQIPRTSVGYGTLGQALISGGAATDATWKSGSRVLLNTLVASASAALQDTTSFTATYDTYEIVFENLLNATNAVTCQLQMHASGAFQSTLYIATTKIGTTAYAATQTTDNIPLSYVSQLFTAAPSGVSGTARIYNWANAAGNNFRMVTVQYTHAAASTLVYIGDTGGYWNSATAPDGIQIKMSAGNITSGRVRIYGLN